MNLDIIRTYCPICLEETYQKFLRREPAYTGPNRLDFADIYVDLVRCRKCSAVFVRRDISPELIEQYYQVPLKFPANLENFYWWLQNTGYAMQHLLGLIAKELRHPLLDVGCGRGVLLHLARQQRWPVTGLEINEEMARFVSQDLGIKCLVGTLFSNELAENSYGVIALVDVLEHLYEPVITLKRCRELLKPGGLVIVKCPHWQMQYLKEQIKYRLSLGSGDIANNGHINQFDPQSMNLAFQQAGLLPMGVFPAQSFLPAIRGTAFNLRRALEYGMTVAINGINEIIYKLFHLNLSFHMLAFARKPG